MSERVIDVLIDYVLCFTLSTDIKDISLTQAMSEVRPSYDKNDEWSVAC